MRAAALVLLALALGCASAPAPHPTGPSAPPEVAGVIWTPAHCGMLYKLDPPKWICVATVGEQRLLFEATAVEPPEEGP